MKTTHLLFAGATVLLFAACGKQAPQSQPSTSEAKPDTAQAIAIQPTLAVPDTFKATLGKVYQGYTEIQTALAQDDLPQAKEAFSSMHAVLHMMPVDGMDGAAKARWDSTDAQIMAALHPMASAESIDSVRAHFVDFSPLMLDAIQTFGLDGDAPVYQFHCPMANDNKGAYWLQKEKALRNPYFGKSMLTCGNMVKTLKG